MICKTLIQNTARNNLFSKRSATVIVGCENRYADCGGELYFIFRDLGVIFNELVWFSNLFSEQMQKWQPIYHFFLFVLISQTYLVLPLK